MTRLTIFTFCFLQSMTALAGPQARSLQKGFHEHDGFFLRLNMAGVGFAKISATLGRDEVEYNGMSGFADLGIGAAVAENLIVHANIFGPVITRPTFRHNGTSVELGESTNVSMVGLGAGLTYYIMPYNMFATLVLGMTRLRLEQNADTANVTDTGMSGQVTFGKEWWVSANWGLGVAATIMVQRLQSDRSNDYWDGHGIGIMFSASYN